MEITAEQARILSRPKDISEQLDEYLDEIYYKIEEFASLGLYNIIMILKPFASSHKVYLSEKLHNNGYKVKFGIGHDVQLECVEYFTISWKE